MAPPIGYRRSPAAVAAIKAGIARARLDPLKWGGDKRPASVRAARRAAFLASLPVPANEDFDSETQRLLDRVEGRGRARFAPGARPPMRKREAG